MARCLGSTMGELKEAAVHVGRRTSGVYLRAKVALDITRPLPVSVTASHEDNSKGFFKASVFYEKLPLFCFCCGVIGHTSSRCEFISEFAGKDLPYGKHILAYDKGSRVDEHTLRRKVARFSWNRPGFERPHGHSSKSADRPSTHDRNTSGLQRLSLEPAAAGTLSLHIDSPSRKRATLEDGEIPPASKALCVEGPVRLHSNVVPSVQVVETDLDRSQSKI
ncbi:unnamed protein product [Linum trigynum]|uniref:Zinc knuckle CX2CX4HX4C domain-containing protein n=1 Tax=Linum trigynum TaxID=586398 RepID=A0AAV2C988_9ROSI